MGNWRTVNIVGNIPKEYHSAMRAYFTLNDTTYGHFNCLMIGTGLCGLGDWIATDVYRIGNLAERDYTPVSVKEVLEYVGEHWPKCNLKVHCGDDYEKSNCVATVVLTDGKVEIRDPEIKDINEIPGDQIKNNLFSSLTGGGKLGDEIKSEHSGDTVKCSCGGTIQDASVPHLPNVKAICTKCGKGYQENEVEILDDFGYQKKQLGIN